jgi:hypothetical protein
MAQHSPGSQFLEGDAEENIDLPPNLPFPLPRGYLFHAAPQPANVTGRVSLRTVVRQ